MLPLGAGFAVFGADGPAVFGVDDPFAHAGVDHRLDREDHPWSEGDLEAIVVVGDLGRFVEGDADSMAYELVDDRTVFRRGVIFDRLADLPDLSAGAADFDGAEETFERDVDDPLLFFGDLSDGDHSA